MSNYSDHRDRMANYRSMVEDERRRNGDAAAERLNRKIERGEKAVALGSAGGIVTGAAIGSVVPVVGTVVGAFIGAVVGAVAALKATEED